MTRIEERIEEFRNQVTYRIERPTKTGGQVAGMSTYPTILEHERLDIQIKIGYFRSNYKNKEMCKLLFDMYFDEIVK